MKKIFLALGLSVTVLMSAAFAQEKVQSHPAKQNQAVLKAESGIVSADIFKKIAASNAVKEHTPLRLTNAYKAELNGKSRIILSVGNAWNDGSGYQMLIDTNRTIIDSFYIPGRGFDQHDEPLVALYAAAEYKIPANASPVLGTTSVLDNKRDTLDMDPGVYDVIVTNPSEGALGFIVYPAGNGLYKKVDFKANYVYLFEVYLDITGGDRVDFHGPCDLALKDISTNVVGDCNIGATSPIQVEVANPGTEAYKGEVTIQYSINGAASVSKKFNLDLASYGGKMTATFDETLNFSKDTLYEVAFSIVADANDSYHGNDTVKSYVIKRSPVASLPYNFNLINRDFFCALPDVWTLLTGEEYPTGALSCNKLPLPLVSRCIELKAGTYYLDYEHIVGVLYANMFERESSYDVLVGSVDEPISEWDTVYSLENKCYPSFEPNDFSFTVKENGTYAIAFCEKADKYGTYYGMVLRNIAIRPAGEYDARVVSFTGIPTMMPVELANGKQVAEVSVRNCGSKKLANLTVKITKGGQELAKGEIKDLDLDKIQTISLEFEMAGLRVEESAEFVAEVILDGGLEDAAPKDNRQTHECLITDDIMAYDYVTSDMYVDRYAVGAGGTNIGCGYPFTLHKTDTLTGVSVGWLDLEAMQVRVRIYKWNAAEGKLGEELLSAVVQRTEEAGQQTHALSACLLEAGSYMISVEQMNGKFFGLICDHKDGGKLYIPTNNPITVQTDIGNPSIRAIFGHDGKLADKDLEPVEISKPNSEGIFGAEQPIVVRVKNNGYEAAEGSVSLVLNGKFLDVQEVKLSSYGEQEYTFKGDLSAPSTTYEIMAFTTMKGDRNPANDTIRKTVRSIAAVTPYIMDFEYCADFDIDDDLAPWKGVQATEGEDYTFGLKDLTFPHEQECFAFIAYNPAQSNPNSSNTLPVHKGERVGVSFGAADVDGKPIVTNHWLISPQLELDANPSLSYFVRAIVDDYGREEYNVLISETDNELESFTKLNTEVCKANAVWTEKTFDLKEYAGKKVYIAFQYVSKDVLGLMLDDIVVSRGGVATEGNAAAVQATVWPNPASEVIVINAAELIQQVAVFNASGKMLYNSSNNLNTEEFRYNVSALNSGLYFARVKTANGIAIVKFVVR